MNIPRYASRRALLGGLAAGGLAAGLGLPANPAAGATPPADTVFEIPPEYTSAGVQAAVNAAYKPGRGAVYLPSGAYDFTSTVEISQRIYILSSPDAVINIAAGVDGFLFRGYNANGQQVVLPTLVGGNRQIRLSGVAVLNLYVGLCEAGKVGVQLETVSSDVSPVSTLDNNVYFQFMGNLDYGVQLLASAPLPQYMQGNVISGNFITGCLHAIDIHGTDAADNITINTFEVAAIDGGNRPGSTGITLSGVQKFGSGGHTFRVPTFFGGFDEKTKYSYVDFPSFVNQFYLRVADSSLEYADLVNLTEGGALPYLGSNKLVFTTTFGAPTLNTPPISAVPDRPDRAAFNGGKTISYNNVRISCAVRALRPGEHQDFYVFTPLLDGYTSGVRATIDDDGGYAYTVSAQDESLFAGSDGLSGPHQVHIRLRSSGPTKATTVVLNLAIN